MSLDLAYSYCTGLTEKEQADIDEQAKKNQVEFCKGFRGGAEISLSMYSLYRLATGAAYASDSCLNPNKTAASVNNGAVPKAPVVVGVSGTRGAALQNVDFYLGLGLAALLVVGGIMVSRNRPHN